MGIQGLITCTFYKINVHLPPTWSIKIEKTRDHAVNNFFALGRTQYLFDRAFFQAYQFHFILFVSMDIMMNIETYLMNILIYFLIYVYTGIYIMSHPNLDSRVGDT